MGKEINLLKNYPKTKRDLSKRLSEKTDEDRKIAQKFGREFFDGERKTGYGGFYYNPRFWHPVIPTFKEFYKLDDNSSVLDVGCAKGFMLYDFTQIIPGIKISGIDISKYAIENSLDEVSNNLLVADARELPFEDNSFDLVISITTVHNFEIEDCKKALREIQRVSKKYSFITVDAFHNEDEEKIMNAWNLTAKTILHVDDWKNLFYSCGYKGDYYWFIP